MTNYPLIVKKKLTNVLESMTSASWLFVNDPSKDFTRNRKLDFNEMLRIILSMGGNSLPYEILEYFSYNISNITSTSAFIQQRKKILPDAFEYLFKTFTRNASSKRTYKGYRLLAVDGSKIRIPYNESDTSTLYATNPTHRTGFNMIHLNAMYDLISQIYVDAIQQPGKEENECEALASMVKRSEINDNTIVIADRHYESYNVMEHIATKGWSYVIRVKDVDSNGILKNLILPSTETFDVDYDLLISRRKTKVVTSNRHIYKYVASDRVFDFLAAGSKDTYPMNFRVIRFPISDNSYEVIVTNLSRDKFSVADIKEIYGKRWGIETSFRELKYTIGLTRFHAKKMEYIIQEIFAKLTMYNFCKIITLNVVVMQKDRLHVYQINFTMAASICMRFFKFENDISPSEVEALIKMYLLPIRPDRKEPRNVQTRTKVSFVYRIA